MERQLYDLIILGGGCAGLTAGIYAGRAGLNTLILESGAPGGQAALTGTIENYPGVPEASGPELMQRMAEQAASFGAELRTCQVNAVRLDGRRKLAETGDGVFESAAMIIAAGASPKMAGFEGEEEYRGKGVGYCAACDGFFFRGKDIFVIGGGNSAAEEALYLTRFGKRVIMLVRKDRLRCEKVIARKVLEHPRIEARFNTELVRAYGGDVLKGAELKNNKTGELSAYTVSEEDGTFGIFVFAGRQPASVMFRGQIELDEAGYILTNGKMETSLPGVFAAGDIRAKEVRQIVTAAADGAAAAIQAEKYIAENAKSRRG